ncbi:MAG TPA: lipopolysaccharide kinase InaA family protein [Gemmataceae bacterium]|nr:lipopolysaccharide kinase InaA family protein [Gemmataceae bacterium]
MSERKNLVAGGVRWQLRPAGLGGPTAHEADLLFGPGGLRLPEWLDAGQAAVVKQNAQRTVYRVALPGLDFHLKQYRGSDRRDRLRRLVRPSQARLEFDRSLAVAERGVPTLVPLAVGEACKGKGPRSGYLATRTLPEAHPLNGFLETGLAALPRQRQARLRQRLAVALGRLLARMHRAGVAHHDLHPGNLLLRLGPDDEPLLYLIDLHAVGLGPPLDWPAARANLVMLNRWFVLRCDRTDRMRCWHAYRAEARGERLQLGRRRAALHLEAGADGRALERRTVASNLCFWRRHDGRCLGHNRYFRRVQGPEVAGHAVADLPAEALASLLADPDAPFRGPGVTVLKDSASSSVVEFDLATAQGPRRVIYKRFALTRWSDPLAALVRPTPALRSYVLGHGLRLRCLPTPRPLAVWHRVRYGLRHEGYLLTEKVPDALELAAFVDRLACLPARARCVSLRRLIDQVARLIATLHQRYLSHRDLKAANLLVSREGWYVSARGTSERRAGPVPTTWDQAQVWFIDLVGVRRHRKLRRRRRLQNLARLHASFYCHPALTRTDKLRFLRVYLRWGLRGRFGWKRWWRQLDEATRAKVRRNLRNGRPLG